MKPSLLLGTETHRDLAELLQAQGRLVLSGASNETAKALLISHLLAFAPHKTLLITGETMVEGLSHWLTFFGCPVRHLEPIISETGEVQGQALQAYLEFMQEPPKKTSITLCTNILAAQDFPLFAELVQRSLHMTVGDQMEFTQFFESLIERGYRHGQDLYIHPGEYRRIGDTLDIFPIQSNHAYRVQFAFDRIEKISAIDTHNLSVVHDAGKTFAIFPVQFSRTNTLLQQIPAGTLVTVDDQDEVVVPPEHHLLTFTAFPENTEHHTHVRYLSVLKFYTLTDFLNDIRDKLQQRWSLVIVTRRFEELLQIFTEEHIPTSTDGQAREGAVMVFKEDEEDLLPHSLQNPDLRCALLTDREIFSLKKAGKQRGIQKLALDFITSLQPGDYVVHMEHGIGYFEGMTLKEIDGVSREYLELTYAEGDKLFVPVDQADKLSKFVTEEGQDPALTRLGTVEWKRLTERMRSETQVIAKELLELYAKRAKSVGHNFGEDTERQRQFEAAFPYEETPGQRKAISDIKSDMESGRPMDRLVCGDVGFGKTEVAMRAAFKAAEAGKQVAVMAPITILADQHYHNFSERMQAFGIKVEMLSRFRSVAQQHQILRDVKEGKIQVLIGTHRLLQPDVEFKNLGLVVIDEEQRFGVKQKERFKDLRSSVDILTMTATPIPRTLNLGLHKLRDISTITTPPPGRLPIITEVRKYSDELVRQSILAELQRGGQCFVLHNRVETIDAFAAKLKALVPEARFVVGHGQLKPEVLEERIVAFKQGDYDVLVSSTIIENGIDLPRANTLIINEAERFGLSQLYQLRGRVGRSKLQAYAYFLYHTQKLKDDARKRLRAIVEACELGSGFQVAMRDLEIRGAGEILGANQSGTMQTVGVSHYLRMLKQAVEDLQHGHKEEDSDEPTSVEIQLHVEALIPSFYIPDSDEKISVYQKLAGSEDEETLSEFETDLVEEYGPLPPQVLQLMAVLRLRLACRKAGVLRVKSEDEAGNRAVVLTLSPRVTAREIMQLLSVNSQWKISGSTLRIPEARLQSEADGKDWIAVLTKQVSALIRHRGHKKADTKAAADTAESQSASGSSTEAPVAKSVKKKHTPAPKKPKKVAKSKKE